MAFEDVWIFFIFNCYNKKFSPLGAQFCYKKLTSTEKIKSFLIDLDGLTINLKRMVKHLVTNLDSINRKIIIMEPFNLYLYELFSSFGMVLYGYACVLDSLLCNRSLPVNISSMDSNIFCPTFTNIFKNIVISVTGFDFYFKSIIKKFIVLLGGKYSDSLVTETTHVICGNAFTKMACYARENNIPLLCEEWIVANLSYEMISLSLHQQTSNFSNILNQSPHFSNDYICKLLHNVKICCLNFCQYKHFDIKNKIIDNGGLLYTEKDIKNSPYHINIDIFLYLNPCQCEYCSRNDQNNEFLTYVITTNFLQLVSNYNSTSKSTAVVTSSWLFTTIRLNFIASINDHLYEIKPYIIASPTNFFHTNKSVVCLIDEQDNIELKDMQTFIGFFSKDDKIEFFTGNVTLLSKISQCYYKIGTYKQFLKSIISDPNIIKRIFVQHVSTRWIAECYAHKQLLSTLLFTYNFPEFPKQHLKDLSSIQHMFVNMKIYVSDCFTLSYLFNDINELKELLVWLGAELVSSSNFAEIIFDNKNKVSKSLYWLESAIYHQQIIPVNMETDPLHLLFFYNGYINPVLKDRLFRNMIFKISTSLPNYIGRHLAMILTQYGGNILFETFNDDNHLLKHINDNVVNIQSLDSINYIYDCILNEKVIDYIKYTQNVKDDSYTDTHHSLLLESLIGTILCQSNSQNDHFSDKFNLEGSLIYVSSHLSNILVSKVSKAISSFGAIITNNVLDASYIVVHSLNDYPEKPIFQKNPSQYKLLLCQDLLEELSNKEKDVFQNEEHISTSKQIMPIQKKYSSCLIDTKLEENIKLSLNRQDKLIELEKDILSIMKNSMKVSSTSNQSVLDSVDKENFNDININSILDEMEKSYNLDHRSKSFLDDSLDWQDNDGVIITYDNGSEDSTDRLPLNAKVQLDNDLEVKNNNHNEHIASICPLKNSSDSKKSYRFLISSLSNEKKSNLREIIQSLNGMYLNTSNFDPLCTHLIIGNEIIKNEKLLSSLASGKIILHYKYLEMSKNVGYFIDDIGFLYSKNCEFIDPIYADIFAYWYSTLNTNSSQITESTNIAAFTNWHVVLHLESSCKQEGFERLVSLAGNAKLYSIKECLLSNHSVPPPLTHIFIENEIQENFSNDFYTLLSNYKDKIYKVDYLADYLLRYNEFHPENYIIIIDFPVTNLRLRRRSTRKRKVNK